MNPYEPPGASEPTSFDRGSADLSKSNEQVRVLLAWVVASVITTVLFFLGYLVVGFLFDSSALATTVLLILIAAAGCLTPGFVLRTRK